MKSAEVVLETALLTHGLPWPTNLQTMEALLQAVEAEGARPRPIGVVGGRVRVGLSKAEILRLAQGGAAKASLWNLAALVAAGKDAGTTVAATVHLAHRAGLEVFATGGIGGVHHTPFDESADLLLLSRTPLLVVASGPKSVLDLEATLERLETYGITVLGFRTDRMPAFLSPDSPYPLPARVETPLEAARVYREAKALGLGGVLLFNPVSEGLPYQEVQAHVEEANREARRLGVTGKDLTPYLLKRLAERTQGRSLEVNRRLLVENARLAAQVALALAGIE